MMSFYDNYDYYKKMLHMQERLRKSEEERIRLEERFKTLMQESRNRHDTCTNRLRLRYIEFLEEQRAKDEKGHKLLDTLNSVDNSLVLMTAKINRLNELKEKYENYQHQASAVRSLPENIMYDMDNVRKVENKSPGRDITVKHLSSEVRSSSSSQSPWLDQTKRLITSPATIVTNETKNEYHNYGRKHVTRIDSLDRPINPLETNRASRANDIKDQPVGKSSLRRLEHKPSHRSLDSGSHTYGSRVPSNSTLNLLNRQNVSYVSTSLPRRLETKQIASDFATPRRIDNDTAQRKWSNTPQWKCKSGISQDYIKPMVMVQTFRPEGKKISWNEVNETAANYRSSPSIVERDVSNISLSSALSDLPRRMYQNRLNYSLRSDYLPDSVNDIRTRLPMTSNFDAPIERLASDNLSNISSEIREVTAQENESKTTATMESKLDRYIDRIQKLHHDLNVQSVKVLDGEDHTYATIPHVSSSSVDVKFNTEKRSSENLSENIEKVLALAGDLASRTATNLNDSYDFEKEQKAENKDLQSSRTTYKEVPVSEGNDAVCLTMREGHEGTTVTLAKDKISTDITLNELELASGQNIEDLEKHNLDGTSDIRASMQRSSKTRENENTHSTVLSIAKCTEQNDSNNATEENSQRNEHFEQYDVSKESRPDQCSFDTVDELKQWGADYGQKETKSTEQIENGISENERVDNVSELDRDDTEEIEVIDAVEIAESQIDEGDLEEDANTKDRNLSNAKDQLYQRDDDHFKVEEDSTTRCETEVNKISVLPDNNLEFINYSADNQNDTETIDLGNYNRVEQNEECLETNQTSDINQSNEEEEEVTMQDKKYDQQNCTEDSNQAQNYAPNVEKEHVNINEEYNYNQNESYKSNQDQNYDQSAFSDNSQQQEYKDYVQESTTEQHEVYSTEQYDGRDDNSANQYEHAYNVQCQERSDQQYAYYQGSDPNQTAAADQSREYVEVDELDHSEIMDRQENAENLEFKQTQQEMDRQQIEETSEKFDTSQDESTKLSTEDEPNQKRDVIKFLLDSDTDSTIERNTSNTENDFDFN